MGYLDSKTSQSGVDGPVFATIPQAARLLGIKAHALRRAVNLGLIPAYQPFGDRRYVRLDEVQAFVESHPYVGGRYD